MGCGCSVRENLKSNTRPTTSPVEEAKSKEKSMTFKREEDSIESNI